MTRSSYPLSPDTLCPRAGIGQFDGNPLEAPIVQSTTFCKAGIASQAAHAYSRVSNPTVSALETALGQLEEAPPAVTFATGLAAETALFLTLLRQGDHIVCGRAVYGGTTRLVEQVLSRLGVESTFVDATRPEAVAAAIRPQTRLVFVETPANPTLEITDIRAVAAVAHRAGVPLAVDNTFMTPVLQRPFDWDADLSVYSTTKFIDGHSVALGGAVVCRDEKLLERLRFVRKSTGGIQTPFGAWLTLQGLKTLPLRIRRQSETAARVARWLDQQPQVTKVYYPTVGCTPQQATLAEEQHLGYHGAVLSFELDGVLDGVQAFLNRLRFCRLVEHVGAAETLITHPATMTHADVSPEDRARVGITDGLVRLSVGLEDAEAIIEDLSQAFGVADENRLGSKEGEACAAAR
jgi:cystathionine beta-lyase/cystathionine gamma-synthase